MKPIHVHSDSDKVLHTESQPHLIRYDSGTASSSALASLLYQLTSESASTPNHQSVIDFGCSESDSFDFSLDASRPSSSLRSSLPTGLIQFLQKFASSDSFSKGLLTPEIVDYITARVQTSTELDYSWSEIVASIPKFAPGIEFPTSSALVTGQEGEELSTDSFENENLQVVLKKSSDNSNESAVSSEQSSLDVQPYAISSFKIILFPLYIFPLLSFISL